MEQRYKSHLRGQDAPQGMVRNQSKPALQLPDIHSSSISKQNEVLSRNDIQGQILNSNRSKKSLSHVHAQQLQSPHGYSMNPPGQDGKLKNYYDMLEKNRQKSIF